MAQAYTDKPTLEAWNAAAEAAGGGAKLYAGSFSGSGDTGTNWIYPPFMPKAALIFNNGVGNTAPYAQTAIVFPDFSRVFFSDGTWRDSSDYVKIPDYACCYIQNHKFGGKQYSFNASGSTCSYVLLG